MYRLNKKNKIIIIILIVIIVVIAYYYIYFNDNKVDEIYVDEKIEAENLIKDEKNNETEKETEKTEKIIVHVSGAVNKEGIVNLPKDSRVINAIEEAGGFKEDAYTKDINFAYKVEDGMKIYVPYNDEKEENNTIIIQNNFEKQSNINTKENENKKVNINKATQTELETLPGIGPSTAMKIINYRIENGSFKDILEIKNIKGIGESKYENIKEFITI